MNRRDHLQNARRNKRIVVNHLLSIVEDFPEWVSIASFYSALHFVEAYFAEHNLDFEYHEERNSYVSNLLPEISSMYLRLYDFSVNSRYKSVRDHPTPDEARELAEIELVNIEEYILSHLR